MMHRTLAIALIQSIALAGCAGTTDSPPVAQPAATASGGTGQANAGVQPTPADAAMAPSAQTAPAPAQKPRHVQILGSDGSNAPPTKNITTLDVKAAQNGRNGTTGTATSALPSTTIIVQPASPGPSLDGRQHPSFSANNEIDRAQREILMRKAAKALDNGSGVPVIINTPAGENAQGPADLEINRAQNEIFRSKIEDSLNKNKKNFIIINR